MDTGDKPQELKYKKMQMQTELLKKYCTNACGSIFIKWYNQRLLLSVESYKAME